MKKTIPIFLCLILSAVLVYFCFNYNQNNYPNELYNVYLDGNYLGLISDKKSLEKYIDDKTNHLINIKNITKTYCEKNLDEILQTAEVQELIKNSKETKKYKIKNKECIDIILENGEKIDKIYSPNGMQIVKALTYNENLSTNEEIYNKIVNLKDFTIEGYEFIIKTNEKSNRINVLNKDIFENAIKEFIKIYVDENEYNLYLNGTQMKVDSVGSLLENVYIEENITFKKIKIPLNQKIYTKSDELSKYLLFGDSKESIEYSVKSGETISDIARNNKISNKEFLISNEKYKNETSLIKPGTKVIIKETNPQISVVVEKYIVEDKVNDYKTIFEYDDSKLMGYEAIEQEGESGIERVSRKQRMVNGNIIFVQPVSKISLKPTIDKVVIKGDKVIPNVGDLSNWAWPSESGWVITDDYAWRVLEGKRSFHHGIDIAGTGYNSDVYAANNGTVITKEYKRDFGNVVIINHNNGYYTVYAHLNKFAKGLQVGSTVSRGQLIGYVGSTGYSFGPHIHFEVWKGGLYKRINPWTIYR